MKYLLSVLVICLTSTANAQQGTKSQQTDLKLAMSSFNNGLSAANNKEYFTSCIYFRASLLHFKSVEHLMKPSVDNVRSLEQKVCKLAGV